MTFVRFLDDFAGDISIRDAVRNYVGDMNMADKLGVNCPCGFTFATPHGQDDAVAVVRLHIDRVHKNDYPNGLSRADALKEIKKVE